MYLVYLPINAQDRYWVFLTDKHNVKFNPHQYFDKKAIERREKIGLSLYDTTDFPLNKHYTEQISKIADKINCEFRWFNAISVNAYDYQIDDIKRLPFVREVIKPELTKTILAGEYDTTLRLDEQQILTSQIELMQAKLFVNENITGEGIRIAVFDAGFPMINKIPAFKHLISNKQIVATWDFARKKANVNLGNPHGTMVLSAIAGKIDDRNLGLATGAEFLLARTEVDRTSIAEEEYWMQAAEWADKNGADIINSSLAYTHERYNTFEMDGKTSLISKAANMAAEKGILVVNAMGNDGNHDWKVMATPADAENVLSIGAINHLTKFHAGFSSFGPTADYRMKPNLLASGHVIVASKNGLKKVKGTSFSAALITGFAACAWQKMSHLSNTEMFEKLQESGNLYPYFDYAHGYGVPKASFFINDKDDKEIEKFKFKISNDTIWIVIDEKYIDKHYLKNDNYLYYHIENQKGYLSDYWLIDVFKPKAAYIIKNKKGKLLRAHYKGYTNVIELK